MIEVVDKYMDYIKNLKLHIDKSPYKTSFIIDSLGMTKQNFYRKMRTENFTSEEILKITKILFSKENLMMELEQSFQDKKEGRFIAHDAAMEILRKKHL